MQHRWVDAFLEGDRFIAFIGLPLADAPRGVSAVNPILAGPLLPPGYR